MIDQQSTPPSATFRRRPRTLPSPTSSKYTVPDPELLYTNTQAEIADPSTENKVHPSKSAVPRPTRKVVDPPGGKQNIRLFGEEYEETDALSLAPPRDGGDGVDVEVERMERMRVHVEPEVDGGAHIEDEKDA